VTDVLAVSLSATDAVGHRFGPDSREMHDQVVRLDRALGAFLDTLFTLRDSTRVLVALTADHGVQSMPEARAAAARPVAAGDGAAPATPRRVTLDSAADAVSRWLRERGAREEAFAFESGAMFLDRASLRRAGVSERQLLDVAARAVRATPGVLRVDRVADLARADTARDAIARRWRHMLPPDYAVPLVVTLQPGSVWGSRLAGEHGTPHDDDARVPLVFWGAAFRPGRYPGRVSVVDLAPTLARVLGVAPTERLDGRVLTEALRGGTAER
jgi:arylsulfatase A-like enzyme